MKLTKPHFSFSARGVKSLSYLSVLMLLGAGVLLSACKQESKASKASDHTGTYTLVTINGNKLPYTPPHEGGAPQVQSGSITLNADGTFTSAMSYGGPTGKASSREFSGTYTREGSRFSLRWKGAGGTIATIEGDTFTMDNEGILFAYRK